MAAYADEPPQSKAITPADVTALWRPNQQAPKATARWSWAPFLSVGF